MATPPTEDQYTILIDEIKDWQLTHGSLIKLVRTEEEHTVLARPIGVSLFPTSFPKARFDEAMKLQPIYNELYAAISSDDKWIYDVLRDLIETEDSLAAILWSIHLKVKENSAHIQPLSLGIFRSDYMLHSSSTSSPPSLKQVEFNTISCAGFAHASIVSALHRHLLMKGAYLPWTESNPSLLDLSSLPQRTDAGSMAWSLQKAHKAYCQALSLAGPVQSTCILIVVQPYNVNIADERPIEYFLWDRGIPTYRVLFGAEFLDRTTLDLGTNTLHYRPALALPTSPPQEVGLVYLRAGYEHAEYDDLGVECRLRIEYSRAIKAPNILGHLATFKKVQQALALPDSDVLLRFLDPTKAAAVAKTFAPLWPLDDSTELGRHARAIATDPDQAGGYVLKPSLEGGGNNVYGDAIPGFLSAHPRERWGDYVLMQRIEPPPARNTLLLPAQGIHQGDVVCELGIWGACLWRGEGGRMEMVFNDTKGHSVRTKAAEVDEMSVVKGWGCFDSLCLIEGDGTLENTESTPQRYQ
ncbi:glutathione synthase [Athelia psychrophila]|uniref:Glutathione synthetase n=1 Tax=Athelia psychrophila TaxID=1759441 RepID=A0A166IQI5_9AGAM|nr:glutathione synthase [Fibularhizoctonia sp. CBS 109695]